MGSQYLKNTQQTNCTVLNTKHVSYIHKTGSIFILRICKVMFQFTGTHGQEVYTAYFFFKAGYKHYKAHFNVYCIHPLISFTQKRHVCKCLVSGCLKLPHIYRFVERKTYLAYLPPLLNHLFIHNIDRTADVEQKVKDQSRTWPDSSPTRTNF